MKEARKRKMDKVRERGKERESASVSAEPYTTVDRPRRGPPPPAQSRPL